MSKAILLLVCVAVPLSAQVAPANPPNVSVPGLQAPPPAVQLQLHPLELNVHEFQMPQRVSYPWRTQTEVKKVCSIPLLQLTPKGSYPMRVLKAPAIDPKIQATPPAPPCDR